LVAIVISFLMGSVRISERYVLFNMKKTKTETVIMKKANYFIAVLITSALLAMPPQQEAV
jgi:hypothetical protein